MIARVAQNCGNCRFAQKHFREDGTRNGTSDVHCHHDAPVAVVGSAKAIWPKVESHHWCGRWKTDDPDAEFIEEANAEFASRERAGGTD